MSFYSESFDVIAIGSGSAACAAALRAAKGGLSVAVVEKSDLLGGTSAMSGAGIWIPANHVAERQGVTDTPADALNYIRSAAPEGWAEMEDALWEAFVDNAPPMLQFIEDNTPMTLELVNEPDTMVGTPGGVTRGRMVSPQPLSRRLLGKNAKWLRRSTLPHSFTYKESVESDLYHHPIRAGMKLWPKLLRRKLTNAGGQGTALMTALIRGCMDSGVTFFRSTTVRKLLQDNSGAIVGVAVEHESSQRTMKARCGVVIASGGFEWNAEMLAANFPGPMDRIGSPRTNTGDGQRMAADVGGTLERMDQANIYPCLPTRYEGRAHGMPMIFQAEPHSIIVNRHGKRFASETDFNIGEYQDLRDPETGEPVNLPCHLIADQRFLKTALPFRWYMRYERDWVKKAATLDELAGKLNVPADQLKETVKRFNAMCDSGGDSEFGRGEGGWEAYKAHAEDSGSKQGLAAAEAKGLGKIDRPPFLCMTMNRSTIGTKGGARTNAKGQVLREDGSIIPGLYAAGLAMANPIGTRAVGAGTTLGPNMTWGYIAAETMLKQNRA